MERGVSVSAVCVCLCGFLAHIICTDRGDIGKGLEILMQSGIAQIYDESGMLSWGIGDLFLKYSKRKKRRETGKKAVHL